MFKIFKPTKLIQKSYQYSSSMPHHTTNINFENSLTRQDSISRQKTARLKLDSKRKYYSTARSVKRPNNNCLINPNNLYNFLTKRNEESKRIYTSQKSLRQKDQIPKINFIQSALQYLQKSKARIKKQPKQKLSFQLNPKTSTQWINSNSSRSNKQSEIIQAKDKMKNNYHIDLSIQKRKKKKNQQKNQKQLKIQNQFCSIILMVQAIQIKICYKVKRIQALIEFLKSFIEKQFNKRSIISDKKIVNFQTIDYNLQLDYYLTLKDEDGSFLNGQTIILRPVYSETQQNVNLNSFQILQTIGSGGFSTVYLTRFKEDGKFYAMKVIDKQFIIKHNKKKIVMNERNVMIELNNNPFLAKLYFAFESKSHLIFIMEYYEGGQLFNILKRFRKMPEQIAKFYITETLLGLQQIHRKGIVYRDFKPQNIMLNISGHVCIADFGLAKPNIRSYEDRAYSFCGSPQYMPPEMIMKNGHSLPVDFYCLGALLYELVTGLPPFYDTDSQKIYQSTLHEELFFPEHAMNLSNDLKDLLYRLLYKQQKYRIGTQNGVAEVLSHPWFKNINKKQYLQKKVKPPVSFRKIQQLKFNIDQMKAENQKLIKNLLKSQKINLQAKYLKVMNGFYYDYRLIESSHVIEVAEVKSKSIKSRFSSKVKNSSSSLALTSCTKRSEDSMEIQFMKKRKQLLLTAGQNQKRSSEQLQRKQNFRMTQRKLFKNLNNYL